MKDEFWRQYNQCLFAYRYNEMKRDLYIKINHGITFGAFLITAISAAGWGITGKLAPLWTGIIFLSQITNALKDQLLLNERVWVINHYLKQVASELPKFAGEWRQLVIGELTESNLRDIVAEHEEIWAKAETDYLLPYSFRDNEKLITLANMRTDKEIAAKHGKG